MKSVLTLLLVLALPPALGGCSAPRPAEVESRTLHFSISGMTCASDCPARVRSALEAVPGVDSATVDYDMRSATVRCSGGTTVESLVSALLVQGFGATPR